MTRNRMLDRLAEERGLREIPSETALSSILAKNVQLCIVGTEMVERSDGVKTKHSVFDVNRELITCDEDIVYSRPRSSMTLAEKRDVQRCSCGRQRIFPPDSDVCVHCKKAMG